MINFNDYAIKLSGGKHNSPESGLCIMEAVSYIMAEDKFTDHPKCACPVITAFAIRTNDWMNDAERNMLLPYVLRIAGSKSTLDIEKQRAYMCADYAVRVFVPLALRTRGFEERAKKLESCAKIVDKATAIAGKEAAYADAYAAAYADAYAAADAAADAYAAADAAAYAYAAAYADADADAAAYADAAAAYKKVRADIVTARLSLLDDMLKLTESIESSAVINEKLCELQSITA